MSTTKEKSHILSTVLSVTAMLLAFILFFAANWFVNTYGRIGFDAILFTLSSDLSGTSASLVKSFVMKGLIPAVLAAIEAGLLLFVLPKVLGKTRQVVSVVLSALLCVGLLGYAAWNVELDDYLLAEVTDGDLYEQHYADPNQVSITFPEQKRNLVYIFLESMETSYLSKELGGAMEENLIPELYDIAKNNVNFSHNADVGGFHCTKGATWTIGAMVAQTAGVPLKTPTEDVNKYGEDGTPFLPGITTLMDILHEEGYYQSLIVGSDVRFGGRESYYGQHNTDLICDIYDARKDGIIPAGYFVWWGMEDLHLFNYAKQKLTELSQQEQPFALSMLTVDTHHVGGYQCELCEPSASGETYDQSISCSSRQVAAFLQWLKQQDFYENTTVIIVGDHESMDNGYFKRMADEDYQRMVYNCFINSAVQPVTTKNRQFAAIDLFPSTLAALGCKIEGERLGLGTNLFSPKPTLAETYGIEALDLMLAMDSEYYKTVFFGEE